MSTLPRITTKVCRALTAFGAWDLIVPLRCTYNKYWKDPAQLAVTEKVLFYRQSTGASSTRTPACACAGLVTASPKGAAS